MPLLLQKDSLALCFYRSILSKKVSIFRKLELPPPTENDVVEITVIPHVLEIFEVCIKSLKPIQHHAFMVIFFPDPLICKTHETVPGYVSDTDHN